MAHVSPTDADDPAQVVALDESAAGVLFPGRSPQEVVGRTLRLTDPGGSREVRVLGVLEKLELTARVQNALDEQYAEVRGFPALGINALVGLRASF